MSTKMSRVQQKCLSKDRFAEKVPSFNFQGKGSMGTWFGLVTTVAFWSCLISFTALKVARLVRGSNPLISATPDLDHYGPEETIDIAEGQMLGAFQVVDFNTKETAIDKNLFSWRA